MLGWFRRRRVPSVAELIRAASAAPCEPRRPPDPRPDRGTTRMTPTQRRQLLATLPVRPYDRTRTPDPSPCPPITYEPDTAA